MHKNRELYYALVKFRQLLFLQSTFKELPEFDNFKGDILKQKTIIKKLKKNVSGETTIYLIELVNKLNPPKNSKETILI